MGVKVSRARIMNGSVRPLLRFTVKAKRPAIATGSNIPELRAKLIPRLSSWTAGEVPETTTPAEYSDKTPVNKTVPAATLPTTETARIGTPLTNVRR